MAHRVCEFVAGLTLVGTLSLSAADPVRVIKDIGYLGEDRKEKRDLYLPPGEAKSDARRPAVLIVHGGGWHGGDKAAGRERNIGANLAQAGYVCASVNYVLAKKQEVFTDNLRQVWPDNLQECMRAVRWLRAHADEYQIDPAKIGAIGGSAGGHLVAMLAYAGDADGLDPVGGPYAKHSCRIQAVVPMYGVYDLIAHAEDKALLAKLNDADRALCRAASAVSYLSKGDPPALLLHGTNDKLVPVRQSVRLHAALQRAGLSSELHIIREAPHSFHLQPKQRDLRELVVGFFDRHLKGAEGRIPKTEK